MTPVVAGVIFVVSLIVTLASSELLVRGLDRLGVRLRLSEGIVGLLTALGADTPEIASGLAALHAHALDVGLGVVLGSTIFNLAALLGVSALLVGQVRVHRAGLLLDGGVAFLVTLLVAALVGKLLAPLPTAVLLLAVCLPYVTLLALPPRRLATLHALPQSLTRFLAVAVSEVDHEAAQDPRVSATASTTGALMLLLPALVLIVGGSEGMVTSALTLAAALHLPPSLIGAVLLAGLTSLPNAYAALRLALQGRGAAVVSETLNSNTINVLFGVALPAVVLGGVAGRGGLEVIWLLGMTLVTLLALSRPQGLQRGVGALLVAVYLLYVVVRVVNPAL